MDDDWGTPIHGNPHVKKKQQHEYGFSWNKKKKNRFLNILT